MKENPLGFYHKISVNPSTKLYEKVKNVHKGKKCSFKFYFYICGSFLSKLVEFMQSQWGMNADYLKCFIVSHL